MMQVTDNDKYNLMPYQPPAQQEPLKNGYFIADYITSSVEDSFILHTLKKKNTTFSQLCNYRIACFYLILLIVEEI